LAQEAVYHDKMKTIETERDGDGKELLRKTREHEHDLRALAVAAEMEALGDLSRGIPPIPIARTLLVA